MLIIVDAKIPKEAKGKLKEYGDLVELKTDGITNDYLSGHPDIFFFQNKSQLIAAPNLPNEFIDKLHEHSIQYSVGKVSVGVDYPQCAPYNAGVIGEKLVHKKDVTDRVILQKFREADIIEVKQGLTRCSLISISDSAAITSDKGIYKSLIEHDIDVLYLDSKDILLPGMEYGLFGGCCGRIDNNLFIIGSLNNFKEGEKVCKFCSEHNLEIVELYDGSLFDGGGLFFIT